jgi:lipopolysaccharide/colanic/teichoic acid biosynthesis glycosyltransferase
MLSPALGLNDIISSNLAVAFSLAYLAAHMSWAGLGGRGSFGRRGAAALLATASLVIVPVSLWMSPPALATTGDVVIGLLLSFAVFGGAATLAGAVMARAAGAGPALHASAFAGLPQAGGDALCFAAPAGAQGAAPLRRDAPLILAASANPVEQRISTMGTHLRGHRVEALHRDAENDNGGAPPGWLEPESLDPDWLDGSGARHEGWGARLARRVFDITLSGGLLIGTLPILVLTAIAIRLETRGPVFYRQERVGRDGRVFTLFKFRSMAVDAEAQGAVWAMTQDPRVTRVGRFIRLTRIDEVPQVLNVLRGEMAFIGPRPERPVFVAQLDRAIPHYADRAIVKPGITGWAQVCYRYGASVEDSRMKLGYDLYYIRHRSLALDLRILAATVRVVMLQEGAR